MTKQPSDFLQFLKDAAKPNPKDPKNIIVNVIITPTRLARIIQQARVYEDFYASADSELATSAEPDATESADDARTSSDEAPLVAIRGEAKKALANLQDRRTALQIITAITDKHLGEE